MSTPDVSLVEVTGTNWRDVSRVRATPDQERFVLPVTYYLALAHYGDDWHNLAVIHQGRVVGHVMWAHDEAEGSIWLGGLVIDADAQRQGIGRAAVERFIERFEAGDETHIALSVEPDNEAARALYAGLGFVETGEVADGELVSRYRPGSAPTPHPSGADPLPRLARLHHVMLAMPAGGEAEAVAFYDGLLGVPQTPKPANLEARGGCWFEAGDVIIHLGVEDDFRPARKAHPALLVEDIDALRIRLAAAGVDVEDDEPLEGFDRFYAYDPFGNRLEFLSPLG